MSKDYFAPHFEIKPLSFQPATTDEKQFTLIALGDILLHEHILRWVAKEQNFRFLWEAFIPFFQQADITYANLEGPMAAGINQAGERVPDPGLIYDDQVYSGYPRFNYFPRLAMDLAQSGIDIVSTANNHALDRHGIGADQTIELLRAAGLPHTGTRTADKIHDEDAWVAVVEKNGLSTAWIGCTYGTNEMPDPAHQVLHWPNQTATLKRLVRRWKDRVDAVFVTPHWGDEDEPRLLTSQVALAHELLESGALAIFGNHPHLVQPMERYLTLDGRETFVIYSLGNFVSAQVKEWQRATILLFVTLTKTPQATRIRKIGFLPAYMENDRTPLNRPTLRPIRGHEGEQVGLPYLIKPLAKEHWMDFDAELSEITK